MPGAFASIAAMLALAICAWIPPAHAEANAAALAEFEAASRAAQGAAKRGPVELPIAGQATLKLPAGYAFVPKPEAERFLVALGNRLNPSFQGMIVDGSTGADWFATVEYVSAGFIRDDDARSWDADKLISDIRQGTDEQNATRRSKGIPEMEIVGWIQKPAYDAQSHQLVWSLASKDKGAASSPDDTINYKTLALGREGYVGITLVTEQRAIGTDRKHADAVLSSLSFDSGKRYADFNESTDRVAEYGLAALVAGAAAKKLGFFAIAAAFLAKFWKVAIIAIAAGGWAGMKKLFARKSTRPQA